ncbi:BRO-N domain-containing protein [Mycolicibacterium fortuitum]|uniref:BRO-N domain-containing protein n=1 Tax=Mycolicibacterium fortuitum TaxID=1766 RepID=UPI0026329CAE|nr:Bro-N domain-containing protein [Mycolicibacterium fortuitum]
MSEPKSTDLVPFDYGDQPVRVVMIDGEPWFVLADLCKVLAISNVGNVASRIDEAGVRQADIRSGGQMRAVTIVNEAGMYEVVIRSDKPEAVAFRRWITGTVLPQIRKTGGYVAEPLDLSDPIAAIEAVREREGRALELAKSERDRAEKAERKLEVEQRHRRAIEGGDGIDPTTFGKKYFSEVPARKFDDHLYSYGYLINQRNTRVRADGEVRDGYDHRKPTAKGRKYFYPHDNGTHGGRRRFTPRVRPQMEIALRDALAVEGLPVNEHSTGLVLITNDDLKELGA